MAIDWIFIILLLFFAYRGYKRGFIVALLSVVALIVGIAAALKLSGTIASMLFKNHPDMARWAPFIVYILVFIAVAYIVKLIARLIQKSLEMVAMGWLNRFAGAILYGISICLVYSVFLWLLTQMNILTPQAIAQSKTYPVLEPFAPRVINLIGELIPILKEGFDHLSQLFGKINQQLPGAVNSLTH